MRIAYVNVFVSDLARSAAFFESTLGLAPLQRADDHGYASFRTGDTVLGLAQVGDDQAHLLGRHTGIGFAVDDLEAEHARLAGLGVAFEMPPSRQPWGGFMALFADPDGNVYYLDEVAAAGH